MVLVPSELVPASSAPLTLYVSMYVTFRRVVNRPIGVPIKYDGRYWMRKEDSLVEMSEDRLRDIFAESGHDFSAEVCPAASMGDLTQSLIEDFRRRWIDKTRRAGNASAADRLAMTALADLAAAGELVPTIAATFPLDEAATAQSVKAGPGKVVLTLS